MLTNPPEKQKEKSSRISIPEQKDASPEVKAIYKNVEQAMGGVSVLIRSLSH